MTTGSHETGAENSLLNELRDLQKYAVQFQSLINSAKDAAPASASAHDTSGAAYAEIDSEGRPTTLKLERGWSAHLTADQIGPALVEAYQSAVQQHMTEWSDDLSRQGWQYDARDMDTKLAEQPTPAHDQFAAPTQRPAPRGVSSIVQDVLDELDEAHDLATAPPAPPVAAPAPTSRVDISFSHHSLASVHVDAEWAQHRDAAAINSELAGALQTARLHQEQQPTASPQSARLDDLFGEVMSALTNHRMEK